jgi:hypothetical protein
MRRPGTIFDIRRLALIGRTLLLGFAMAVALLVTGVETAHSRVGMFADSRVMVVVLPFIFFLVWAPRGIGALALGLSLWLAVDRAGAGRLVESMPVVDDAWLLASIGVALGILAFGTRRFLIVIGVSAALVAGAVGGSTVVGHGAPLLVPLIVVLVLSVWWIRELARELLARRSASAGKGEQKEKDEDDVEPEDRDDDLENEADQEEDLEPNEQDEDFDPEPADDLPPMIAAAQVFLLRRRVPLSALLLLLVVIAVLLMTDSATESQQDWRAWILGGVGWAAMVWTLASIRFDRPNRGGG